MTLKPLNERYRLFTIVIIEGLIMLSEKWQLWTTVELFDTDPVRIVNVNVEVSLLQFESFVTEEPIR
jgi:hypothetical protein